MIRTRVGYAGGTKADPTYHSLGDHSETIQIDYDPTQISYEELLDVFWNSHSPTARPWSRQYASLIFYHDEEQKRLAEETRQREETDRGGRIYTEIVPFSEFYLAEDYHQKYRMRQVPDLMEVFRTLYPDWEDFLDSTLAARVNGYVGGYGNLDALEAIVDKQGMVTETRQKLLDSLSRFSR